MQAISFLFIAPSSIHKRGVFTSELIPKGSIIEIAPVIVIPDAEVGVIHDTVLHDFYFRWGVGQKQAAIALGYASIYNHSFDPNMRFTLDYANESISFYAYKVIESGEELTFNYNGDPSNLTKLWFHE